MLNRNLFLVFGVLVLILSCQKDIRWDENMKAKGYLWAGSPEKLQTEPYEYFYIKRTEYLTEKILDKKNETLFKETCRKQSKETAKPFILEAMITGSLPKGYNTPFRFIQEQNLYRELNFDYKEKSPELLKCDPVKYSLNKTLYNDYEICECILYFHHKGGIKDIEKRFDNYWRLMDEKFWVE